MTGIFVKNKRNLFFFPTSGFPQLGTAQCLLGIAILAYFRSNVTFVPNEIFLKLDYINDHLYDKLFLLTTRTFQVMELAGCNIDTKTF